MRLATPEQLIFVISAPRSGSTLLQRMLASHPEIYSHPEPHLITPLYYLGYYDTVERAPYDHVNAAQALREFCQELPGGEEDYLDALRAYATTLYDRVLGPTDKRFFVDKTPAYALVLPFLRRLFPHAKYIVLTRHPMAIMHSVAHSFFGGDYAAAREANPIVERYVPAIAACLADPPAACTHVRYEDLVREPEAAMQRLAAFIGVPYAAEMVTYGAQRHISKSYGDPVGVARHDRPVTASLATWQRDFLARPEALRAGEACAAKLSDTDLALWGYPRDTLFAGMQGLEGQRTRRKRLDSYQLQRKALLALRGHIRGTQVGEAVRRVRYYCDVLLR